MWLIAVAALIAFAVPGAANARQAEANDPGPPAQTGVEPNAPVTDGADTRDLDAKLAALAVRLAALPPTDPERRAVLVRRAQLEIRKIARRRAGGYPTEEDRETYQFLLADLDAVLRSQPANVEALITRCFAHRELYNWEPAAVDCRAATAPDAPTIADPVSDGHSFGTISALEVRLELALRRYNENNPLAADDPDALEEFRRTSPVLREAALDCLAALARLRDFEEAWRAEHEILAALCHNNAFQFEEALKSLEVVETQLGNTPEFLNMKFEALLGLRRYDEAVAALTRLRAVKPEAFGGFAPSFDQVLAEIRRRQRQAGRGG